MTQHNQHLFNKGYVQLSLGSYRVWIHKNWHEYAVSKKWVKLNHLGMWIPVLNFHVQLGEFLKLYDIWKDALEYNKKLEPDIYNRLVLEGLIKPQQ